MAKREQTILISGASSGIGRHCALRLDGAGFKVFAGVRNEKAGRELEQEATGPLKAVILDVTDRNTIEDVARIVRSENLYGIVNNAGVAVLGPLEYLPIEEIREEFEVNLFGHIAVTQALLPFLRQSGSGRIINMSSISGFLAFPFYGAYAASKFALEGFNDSLRRELKPWEIKVISIQPGNVATHIWHKSFSTAKSMQENFPSEAKKYYKKIALKSDRTVANMIEPTAVSSAVLNALTAKRPKRRYRVGLDARKYALYRWIFPDWLFDRVL